MCRYFVGIQLVAIQVVAIQVVGIQVVEQGMPFGFQRVLPLTDIRHWQIVVECQLSAVSVMGVSALCMRHVLAGLQADGLFGNTWQFLCSRSASAAK